MRDEIALSNLHRQTLFTEEDCGRPKAAVAAERCHCFEFRRNLNNRRKKQALTAENVMPSFIGQADIILDCADSYAASYTSVRYMP